MQKKFVFENTNLDEVLGKVLLYFISCSPQTEISLEDKKGYKYILNVGTYTKIMIYKLNKTIVVEFVYCNEKNIKSIMNFVHLEKNEHIYFKYVQQGQISLNFKNFIFTQQHFNDNQQEELEKLLERTVFSIHTVSFNDSKSPSVNISIKADNYKYKTSINIGKDYKIGMCGKVDKYLLQLLHIILYNAFDITSINSFIFDETILSHKKRVKQEVIINKPKELKKVEPVKVVKAPKKVEIPKVETTKKVETSILSEKVVTPQTSNTIKEVNNCEVIAIHTPQGKVFIKEKEFDVKSLNVFTPTSKKEEEEEKILQIYLPYSYKYHTNLNYRMILLQVIEDLKVERTYYDYSQLVFGGLRALEGHLTYVLSNYINAASTCKVFSHFLNSNTETIHKIIKNENVRKTLLNTYNYYKNERHNLFHCPNEENKEEVRIIDNLLDTKIIILNCLKLIDDYYKIITIE